MDNVSGGRAGRQLRTPAWTGVPLVVAVLMAIPAVLHTAMWLFGSTNASHPLAFWAVTASGVVLWALCSHAANSPVAFVEADQR